MTTEPELIIQRYEVVGPLGRGGMAAVYQVHDRQTQRVLALKRLFAAKIADRHVTQLFELEYHTLSQLVHPRIIEVYDYHTDEQGPFYTMELLSGGDLRQRSPLSWREACRLLCDVCSALALLHSRRFVHRDLTPMNVRCTADERAKLFDFGSMTQFGRSKHVVGTPPFVAPEALHGQVLDGQTDLYALGATAYYALTGRHAFPARDLSALPDLWLAAPAPPSHWVAGIPPALDDLVLSLLQLAPNARPPSAAEVMERLSAIGGFAIQEALLVSEAYLATPTLVGRHEQAAAFQRQLVNSAAGRGGSLLIHGEQGSGRSRFLDACRLEAKLSGALVLQVDVADSAGQRWGAASALIGQLLEQLPQLTAQLLPANAALIEPVMPELVRRFSPEPMPLVSAPPRMSGVPGSAVVHSGRAELQATLRDLVLAAAARSALVLIVDDIDRIDEPSAALLALLAHRAQQHRLLVVSSTSGDPKQSDNRALQLIAGVSDALRLRSLDAEQTQQLVISLFGDVPNVRWLGDRIFAVTRGVPGLVMKVAAHVVQAGLCSYAAGTWTLPASLPADVLSSALREQLDPTLSVSALELARTLALSELARVSIDDCLRLCTHASLKQLQAELYELAAANIVTRDQDMVALSRPALTALLLDGVSPEQRRPMHRRIAELCEQRPADHFLWIQHLLRAGDVERAITLAIHDIEIHRDTRVGDPLVLFDYIQSLPKQWPLVFHDLIDACRELGRPLRDRLTLQLTLLGYSTLTARSERNYLLELAEQLRHDAGLDLVAELSDRVPPDELLAQALGAAQARFDAAPDAERGYPVMRALPLLAQVIIQAIGMTGRAFDLALLEAMPSLAPVAVLSPALAAVQKNLESSMTLQRGNGPSARGAFLELAQRLSEPDGAGLGDTHRVHMQAAVTWAVGLTEACEGKPSANERVAAIENNPLFAVSALRTRTIAALYLGDRATAERFRAKTELVQIQNSPPQLFEGREAMPLTLGYAAIGDLLRVKQYLVEVEAMARAHDGWKPIVNCGRGAYQALRGDHAKAQAEFEHGLTLMAAGRHAAWTFCAGSLIWAVARQERYAEAVARGRELLTSIQHVENGGASFPLLVPLAFAEAHAGHFEEARQHVRAAIDYLSADGGRGVLLGEAYEVAAYIALQRGDAAGLREYAARCETEYALGGHATLLARHERLLRAARKAGLINDPKLDALKLSPHEASIQTDVSTVFSAARGPEHRASNALSLIARYCGCDRGFLYLRHAQGPVAVAQLGAHAPTLDLDRLVTDFLEDALSEQDVTQTDASDAPEAGPIWTSTQSMRYAPLLLTHAHGQDVSVTGVAVMVVDANATLRVPARLLQALSKAFYDSGDALTQLSARADVALES